MATGRFALALDGRASHHGCIVSAGAAVAGRIAAIAPNPPAPALRNPLRPSPDGRDAFSAFFMIALREQT
jgi:hypothetical protein